MTTPVLKHQKKDYSILGYVICLIFLRDNLARIQRI